MKKVKLFRSKALALSVMMAFTLTACGGGTSTSSNTNSKTDTVDGTENTVNKPDVNKEDIITMPVVHLETSMGQITLELNDKDAPKSVENFLNYVNSGHYNGTIFHRVIDGFMIQGGGFDNTMTEKPSQASIENEADNGLKNDVGTIAMARTSAPHSASSQFFINVNNNNSLNHTGKNPVGWGYAVFGKVTEGMDVVNKIKGVATGNKNGHQNVPTEPVTIISATVIKKQ